MARWNLTTKLALLPVLFVAPLTFAQSVPEKFVVSGKAAQKIQDHTTINLATAQRIAETCEGLATARGAQQSIIILDNDGNHVYMDRMDGQGYTNIVTPEMKARTALITRGPSKAVMNRVERDPNQEAYEVQLGHYPVAGGLPIVVNQQMIGVIGVGGFRPSPPVWSDEICARTAMIEVLGTSVPPLLEDVKPETEAASKNPVAVPTFGTTVPPKATLPAEWVVGGAAAAHVFDGNQLSLVTVKKIARACRDWAAAKDASASIYILDMAGEFLHMERMDGQLSEDIRTALLKAQTALRLREPTSLRGNDLRNVPHDLPRNTSANIFNFYLSSGGIPIVVDGQMVGSIGVSGLSDGNNDENCAIEGLKAAFGQHATLPIYKNGGAQTH